MAFYQLGQMDKARYSAQIAYNKIPNNVTTMDIYSKLWLHKKIV